METSFDVELEQHIEQWRESLGSRPGLCDEDVEELEAHLRDTIRALEPSDLQQDEAFLIAARRVGEPAELEQEYATAHSFRNWSTGGLLMVKGILGYWILVGAFELVSRIVFLVGKHFSGTRIAEDSSVTHLLFPANGYHLGWVSLGIQFALAAAMVVWLIHRDRQTTLVSTPVRASIGVFWLFGVGLILKSLLVVAEAYSVRIASPTTLGEYYVITQFGPTGICLLAALTVGAWLSRKVRTEIKTAA